MVMAMQHSRHRSTGFTVVELMVALVVLIVLIALAAPAFNKIVANQRVRNASFDMFSAMNYARSEAVKRGVPISLRAGATSNGAWTTGWRITDAGGGLLRSWGARSGLDMSEESASLTTVTYGRDGRLTSASPRIAIAPTVAVDGVTSRCVTVDLSGRPNTKTGACS
jgi:type IV fimbrial biogenesis protein FimT